jgi:hypothetical protein
MVTGTGDRILKAAAQRLNIIAISGFFDIAIGGDPDLGLARVYRPAVCRHC